MINIEELEKKVVKKRSFWVELRDFIVIFFIIFSFWWLFINAQLFIILFDNIFDTKVSASDLTLAVPKIEQVKIQSIHKNQLNQESDNFEKLKRKLLLEKINWKLNKLWIAQKTDIIYKPSYDSLLKSRLASYHLNFNTLPPDPRLIIPKIGVNVHIVTLSNIPMEVIQKADYDKYLYHWVVKYPYTPDPGTTWNVFIFGHSSYYWWKHNPYGTVFAKIPALRHGDIIEVIWNWKTYKYKIFKKLILWPYEVDDVYKRYTNWKYLSIMACYPIGTDRQRMLILAKIIK